MLKLFENRIIQRIKELTASVEDVKAGRLVEGDGCDGRGSGGGGGGGAGGGSWEQDSRSRSSDPGLHQVMKKLDTQQEMMCKLMSKADRQQGALEQACALIKRQAEEMQELKASLSHGQSNPAVLEADTQGHLRHNGSPHKAQSATRLHRKPPSPRTGFSRKSARLDSPRGLQESPVYSNRAEIVYAPPTLQTHDYASLPLRDTFKPRDHEHAGPGAHDNYASLPLRDTFKLRHHEHAGPGAHDNSVSPNGDSTFIERAQSAQSNTNAHEQSVSGALERGILRNLSFYRKRLEMARDMGDVDQEADALMHVCKWEKWLEARTGSGSN